MRSPYHLPDFWFAKYKFKQEQLQCVKEVSISVTIHKDEFVHEFCESDLTVHDIALESHDRNYAQWTGNFKIDIWRVIHFISVISQAQSEAFPSWISGWSRHVRNSINRNYQRLLDPIISPIITEIWRNMLQAKGNWIFSRGWRWRILHFG